MTTWDLRFQTMTSGDKVTGVKYSTVKSKC